jgi:TolB-like protein/DNA-binding winged helix-turn-helix (wHTH) protein/predicted Zn-dependent protease
MLNGPILSFGPYQLDTEKVRLWCDTQPIRLTPKAFQVLCYVVERPGQLVTKEELFRVVWADTVVGDAALTMCIQEIRKALQDNAKSPRYLETVHRQGFRFIAEVQGLRSKVQSQDEKQQEICESEVESKAQSRESKISSAPSDDVQTLDPRHQTLDESAFTRFWSRNRLILTGLVFLVSIIIAVQYLSLPTPTPQAEIPNPQSPIPSPQPPPLPDKPSIIVLPFVNLSGDPGQEYFSDGMTEEITSSLSRLSSLFVIARTSASTYKGKAVKVQDVSREMGVRYVLEGSVRKSDNQVRITAQLIDATTGGHLWSERYDRPLKDIFALQDEIVQKIVTTLKLQLTLEEQGFLVRKTTENLEAYDYYLRGLAYFVRFTKEANRQARQMYEKAIALDPQYAQVYVDLGYTYYLEWAWRWSADPQTLEQTLALAQKAVSLNDFLPGVHSILSRVYASKRQYEQAIMEGERAIALAPNLAESYANQAEALNIAGRPEDALRALEQAMRLNPRYPAWYLGHAGWAYNSTGRYEEAIAALKTLLLRNPNILTAYTQLTLSYLCQWAFQLSPDTQTLEQALAAAQRGVALNDSTPWGHSLLGYAYLWQKQYDQAITEMERAIALDPTDAISLARLAETLSRVGRLEEAVAMAEQALRRKSLPPDGHLVHVGAAYYLAGRPEEALAPLKQYLTRYPNNLGAHLALAAVYSELGKDAEARAAAAEVLRINPNYSLEVARQRSPDKDPAAVERRIAALRKAGLK